MIRISNWLKKPYPLLENLQQKLLLASSFGVFVAVFLMVFQPFDADTFIGNKYRFLSGFGLCVFLGLSFTYILLPYVFPRIFHPERWNIGKEILYLISTFLVIAHINYFYNTYVGANRAVYRSLPEFIGITIAVGILPVIIFIFLLERSLSKKNTQKAVELSATLEQAENQVTELKLLSIQSENLKEPTFSINHTDFIFATSDNNYTTIYYTLEDHVQSRLLRLSISSLESQLTSFPEILRCHRSYLINKNKIQRVKGNARSLVVFLEGHDQSIPVSRSFAKERLI